VPELPEVQAHAERLDRSFRGKTLTAFVPFNFTVLKTAVPAPDVAIGEPLLGVGRRGKYLLLRFAPVTFAVHLMQGGRLLVDHDRRPKPRNGQARFEFGDGDALLLTEAGRERRAGVWCMASDRPDGPPLDRLGPDALDVTAASLADDFAANNMRLHGYLRDQHRIAGVGRMLANEICHRARLSPFVMTRTLGADGADLVARTIRTVIDEALDVERQRDDMSSSADRPGDVHHRVGQPCNVCGDIVRSVSYSSYTVAYCPTCQTGGKVLADNTTSRFLK